MGCRREMRVQGPPTLAACWMGKGGENLPLSLLTPPKCGGGGGRGGGGGVATPTHLSFWLELVLVLPPSMRAGLNYAPAGSAA